jgi:hypothetical protein
MRRFIDTLVSIGSPLTFAIAVAAAAHGLKW